MHEFLKHELFKLRLKFTLLDLVDLEHRPRYELLHLGPPMVQRFAVEHDNDEFEIIFDEGSRQAGSR